MMGKPRIAVVGCGAIGSLVAAQLVEHDYEVVVYGRGAHVRALREMGLRVTGKWACTVAPQSFHAVSLDDDDDGAEGIDPSLRGSCAQAIITGKAKDTARLAEVAAFLSPVVLSLQNGLGNLEHVERVVGSENAAVGITTNAVTRSGPGEISWVGRGTVQVGGPMASSFVPTLCCLGAEVVQDVEALLWHKLLLNVAINPLAAILGVTNGGLLEASLFQRAQGAMLEAALVARALGIGIDDDETLVKRLRWMMELSAENVCSMLADVRHGRETEIDSLCGQVVLRGEKVGVPTPINAKLVSQVRALTFGVEKV